MGQVILVLVFVILASICNSIMDVVSFHYYNSLFHRKNFNIWWWNPEYSWRNKYIDRVFSNGRVKLFYKYANRPFRFKMLLKWKDVKKLISFSFTKGPKVYDPEYCINISVNPVQFSDAWHFFKMLMIIFNSLSVSCAFFDTLPYILLGSLVIGIVWNTVFSLFWNKVLK